VFQINILSDGIPRNFKEFTMIKSQSNGHRNKSNLLA